MFTKAIIMKMVGVSVAYILVFVTFPEFYLACRMNERSVVEVYILAHKTAELTH